MAGHGLSVSPGFLLLAAFLYYAGGGAALTAFFTAMLVHELGHLAAMLLTGTSVRALRLTAAGPVIEYEGTVTARQETGIIAAGPLAGLLFAWGCLLWGSAYFRYVGLIALLSSVFNLLPVLPMDGGRLLSALLCTSLPERAAATALQVLGSLCGAGICLTGIYARAPAAAAMGIWLTALANLPKLR